MPAVGPEALEIFQDLGPLGFRLLQSTTPFACALFTPYEPFLIGGGGALQYRWLLAVGSALAAAAAAGKIFWLAPAAPLLLSAPGLLRGLGLCISCVEPQSPNGKNIIICTKSGVCADPRKSAKKCGKPQKVRKFYALFAQKVWFSALFGTLSGIGGNPTFCAD